MTSAIGFVIGFALFGALTYLPLFQQVVRGASPTESGLQLIPVMAGVLIGSIGSGAAITATGRYKVFPIVGTAIAVIGMLLLTQLDAGTSTLYAYAAMFVLGLGLGLVMQVLVLAVQNAVDYADLGVATSSASLFRSMGGSLGTAALGAVFTARLTGELAGTPAAQVGEGGANPAAIQRLPAAIRDTYTGAFSDSLSTVFLVAAVILAVAFLLAWLIEERPLRQTVDTAGVGEAFATPSSGDSLRELTRELARLVGRERTQAFIERTVEASGVDLPVGPAWLLVQAHEGVDLSDADTITKDRPIDAAWVREQVDVLNERGLVEDHQLTDRGQADRRAPDRHGAQSLQSRSWPTGAPTRTRASTTRSTASPASSRAKPRRPANASVAPDASAALSSARDVIPSFGNTRYRCVLIVRCERYSRWPISRFDKPVAASCAICSSCAVSSSRASGTRRRLRSPEARSSERAWSPQLDAPMASNRSRASRSGARESITRRWRRSHAAVGEQQPATPEGPAIEVRAEGLLEARGRFALVVGEHGPGMAEVDRDPFGRGVAHQRLDLGQPLARRRRAAGERRGLGEVADGHAGELQVVGRIAAGRTAARRAGAPRHGDRAPAPTGSARTGRARRCGVAPSGSAICSARAVARSVAAGSPRTAAIIAIAVSAVASQIGWPSSVASRRASSAAGIAMSQSGRRTARIACVASRRGRAPRRPSARALSIAVAQNVRLS